MKNNKPNFITYKQQKHKKIEKCQEAKYGSSNVHDCQPSLPLVFSANHIWQGNHPFV
jgi:hypothetical protein